MLNIKRVKKKISCEIKAKNYILFIENYCILTRLGILFFLFVLCHTLGYVFEVYFKLLLLQLTEHHLEYRLVCWYSSQTIFD